MLTNVIICLCVYVCVCVCVCVCVSLGRWNGMEINLDELECTHPSVAMITAFHWICANDWVCCNFFFFFLIEKVIFVN